MTKVTTAPASRIAPNATPSLIAPLISFSDVVRQSLDVLTSLPALRDIFHLADERNLISLEAARSRPVQEVSHFKAWPVFLGLRYSLVEGAVFNQADLERNFSEYISSDGPSRTRGSISEAVRYK